MREVEDILVECYRNVETFGKTFFPEAFTRPFSNNHRKLLEILDDDSKQLVAIAAYRGFGKSTIVNLTYPAREILFRKRKYIISVSASENAAVEQTESMKGALEGSEEITRLFGPIRSEYVSSSDSFSKKEWVTSTGTKILPRGAGQQVRGRRHGFARPDLIIVDDLENDEAVESEDRRKKLKEWFFSSIYNNIDRGRKDWRIIVIGTILHEDSLLSNLLADPEWYSVKLEICDDNYKSTWPEFVSDEQVKALAESYRARGMLDVFYREYRNIPIALEEQGFKQEYFRYYEDTEESLNMNPDIETIVLADPARTMNTGSANTAVVGISINTRTNAIYIRDIIEAQMNPGQLYDEMFGMAQRLNALVLAPEVTGLNEYIMFPLRNEMIKRNLHYILIEVKPREGKTGPKRSAGMIPLYRQGLVYHNKANCGPLERRLLQWPRPDKWDVIDAVSGIIFVMEDGERYFSSMQVATPEDIEKEYKDLKYEPALTGFAII